MGNAQVFRANQVPNQDQTAVQLNQLFGFPLITELTFDTLGVELNAYLRIGIKATEHWTQKSETTKRV